MRRSTMTRKNAPLFVSQSTVSTEQPQVLGRIAYLDQAPDGLVRASARPALSRFGAAAVAAANAERDLRVPEGIYEVWRIFLADPPLGLRGPEAVPYAECLIQQASWTPRRSPGAGREDS